jgi:hypothetical protein
MHKHDDRESRPPPFRIVMYVQAVALVLPVDAVAVDPGRGVAGLLVERVSSPQADGA